MRESGGRDVTDADCFGVLGGLPFLSRGLLL